MRGKGVNMMNNESIVFNQLCKMTQPIRTHNDMFRKTIKKHRDIDLSYNQMREILNSLYNKGKITIEKVGNLSLISTVLPDDMRVFPQPLEHKKHNTPPYVYKFFNLITRVTRHEGCSMSEAAKKIFYDAYNPSKYSADTAERNIRDAYNGIRTGRYIMKNGMPFTTYIGSETKVGGRGYFTFKTEKELNIYLKKKKVMQLKGWYEYWYEVNWASRDGQVRYTATKSEKAIHNAIKKELEETNETNKVR